MTQNIQEWWIAKKPEPWADYQQAWVAFVKDGNLEQFQEAV